MISFFGTHICPSHVELSHESVFTFEVRKAESSFRKIDTFGFGTMY